MHRQGNRRVIRRRFESFCFVRLFTLLDDFLLLSIFVTFFRRRRPREARRRSGEAVLEEVKAFSEVEETSEKGLVAVKVVDEESELVFKEDKISLDSVEFLGREATRGRDLEGLVDQLFSGTDGLAH